MHVKPWLHLLFKNIILNKWFISTSTICEAIPGSWHVNRLNYPTSTVPRAYPHNCRFVFPLHDKTVRKITPCIHVPLQYYVEDTTEIRKHRWPLIYHLWHYCSNNIYMHYSIVTSVDLTSDTNKMGSYIW